MSKINSDITRICDDRCIKITSLREQVIGILSRKEEPCSAYEILESLKEHRHNAEPITVYRVLNFLVANNLVHRLEAQKKYILCCHPNHGACQIFICSDCGKKLEMHDKEINNMIKKNIASSDFELTSKSIELYGHCKKCKSRKNKNALNNKKSVSDN
ncbi:MAG TPA: hypothetical protein DD381_08235 [Lentisphaeria bacterium]|nr:MAG: hypothetical protein A2X47_04795 [Lentisphaerae bacterium GWF2_38_69]HBM16310.1 hypothetical protein [Lentisphaeria bacterium]